MNLKCGRLLLALATVLTIAPILRAQSDAPKKPLTEEALIKLIKGDLEEEVIVALVKKRGVSFKAEAELLGRLKEEGASEGVLSAVRETSTGQAKNGKKVLATETHSNGLIVEVTEVKPDDDRALLTIRWRYRNPTMRVIQLFGEGPTFVVPARSDERWLFIHGIYFLSGGQGGQQQFRHSVVNDTGGKSWCKPIGKKPVRLGPDEEYEFWAKFELQSRTTKKISLQLEEVPLIEGLPVQWAAKK
jgi:hypothetical protein